MKTPATAPQPQGIMGRIRARIADSFRPRSEGVRYGAGCGSYRDSAYAGASLTRKQLANWTPQRSPADVDLLPDYPMLVARARDLDRNNGVAAGCMQTVIDNTVGVGLRLACSPNYQMLGQTIEWAQEWSREVESLWRTWAGTTACDVTGKLTFNGLTQLVFRSCLENGEALALPLWMERSGTPFRTCLQLVDTDRLSNPHFTPSSLKLRGGVEMDDYGKPTAYYIQRLLTTSGVLPLAFGPYGLMGNLALNLMSEWERIPAETPFGRRRVLHIYQQDRVDQTRGKPVLTPVIEQFRLLDAYQRTELQTSIANSLVAGVIETPMDPASIYEMMGGDAASAAKYYENKSQARIDVEGGTFFPIYPGDKLTPFTPTRPASQFGAFCETVLRQIGAALGLPYELVLKDFSKTNYSSARAALNEAWRGFMNRRVWLATYWAQPVYQLWFEEAVNAGLIDAPDFYDNMPFYLDAKWIGPGRGVIDPVKEAEASQVRMDTMISTLEIECAEQGLDYYDVLDQRKLEMDRMKELGLTPPEPLKPSAPRGETPGADPAEEPPPSQQQQQKEAA